MSRLEDKLGCQSSDSSYLVFETVSLNGVRRPSSQVSLQAFWDPQVSTSHLAVMRLEAYTTALGFMLVLEI